MRTKLKIRDLEIIILGTEKICVYRSLSSSYDSDKYEDLYSGSFECIPDTLKDCDIFIMYPSLTDCNRPYISIQIG